MSKTIKIAIAGVGNCASSLIQGIEFYKRHGGADDDGSIGLMHWDVQGYTPASIEVVAAFDIDRRKINKPLTRAIFAKPNCTKTIISDMPPGDVIVRLAPILDGFSQHMKEYPPERAFVPSDDEPCDVEKVLRESGAEVLLNYLPVGSQKATEFYATCCLNTGVSLINCMPVFIVSDPAWAEKFKQEGIPVVGDDIKSQIGATIIHRMLTRLFQDRGVKLERTYQLNTGGNTDFLNMLNHDRLKLKRISKTEAVQSQLKTPLKEENIHIGPSDYVPWQKDNKVCFLRMEGTGFAGIPMHLEMRLSVEDSPNSGGVAIDAIRYVKIARERKIGGPLYAVSAYTMKHPPRQMSDNEANQSIRKFLEDAGVQCYEGIKS